MKYGFFPGCAYKTSAGYEASVNAVNDVLGISLTEISDWNCCGATAAFSTDEKAALTLTGRIMALAAGQGFKEIVTVCNACFATLKKAGEKFDRDPVLLQEVNQSLKTDRLNLERAVPVRHYMDVLLEDILPSAWPEKRKPFCGGDTKIAAYYGCQLVRPHGDRSQAERPDRLERLLANLGLPMIAHSARTLCCGASHIIGYEKECLPLISRITGEVQAKGADIITTICPMCQFNLDYGQGKSKGRKIPVTYFTQIIGLALGIDPKRLGLDKLLIPLEME